MQQNVDRMTTMTGCPIADAKNSITAGPIGPVVFHDTVLMEKINQFARERIPPRNVHALGFGAHGTFTVTNDISKFCCARLFSQVGKKTEVFIRFSGVFTEPGDPQTMRDLRGFAAKFYSEDGIWDVLTVNTPCFNARDLKVGPDAIHAFKKDPRTNEWNPTQTWDFIACHPESLHNTLMLYTDRVGHPLTFRHQNWFPCNTFSFINEQKERFWVRFHFIAEQGWRGMTQEQALKMAGENPSFYSQDMRESILAGKYPKWKLYAQIMREEDGYKNPQIAFDATKVWKHDDYPMHEIGVIEANRYSSDYFAEVDQVAFSPANVPPGISFSPDKLLQGRLMLYDSTQYHRLGPNFKQIPINCPFRGGSIVNAPIQTSAGQHRADIKSAAGWPQYYPSLFGGPKPDPLLTEPLVRGTGDVGSYAFINEGTDEDYYAQARDFIKILKQDEMTNLVHNLGTSLSRCDQRVASVVIDHFTKIDPEFATRVNKEIDAFVNGEKKTPEADLHHQLRQEAAKNWGEDI